MAYECDMSVFAAIGPFDDELLTGDYDAVLARIRSMTPVAAVQLVLATYCRGDSVIDRNDLDSLAEFLGVFGDDVCESCDGCGYFDASGTPTIDRTGRKCLDCRGSGKK